MHVLLLLSHPSLFGRARCFGEEDLFGVWILKCCPMGIWCGTGVLLDISHSNTASLSGSYLQGFQNVCPGVTDSL